MARKKRKKRVTSYTIKLTELDKEILDRLRKPGLYSTRAAVIRSLPERFQMAIEDKERMVGVIESQSAELGYLRKFKAIFESMISSCGFTRSK